MEKNPYFNLFKLLPCIIIVCSCTIPHKESLLQCCDEVDPVAKVSFIFIETLSVEADVDDY